MLMLTCCRQAKPTLLFVVFAILVAMASGCGRSVDDTSIKDFRLTLANNKNPQLHQLFSDLVADFNRSTGREVLRFVATPEEANSAIIVTKGLQKRDGKVGWGQPLAEIDEQQSVEDLNGVKVKRTTRHFMRVEFDEDYLISRLPGQKAENQNPEEDRSEANAIDLKKLFSHEVGHGLEMGHETSNKGDLMYPDISGTKDFASFFAKVRAYFD